MPTPIDGTPHRLDRRALRDMALLAVLGAAFFLPFLDSVHLFDWDEANFAECSREMLLTGNFTRVQIDYKPFWEKPPLFFWLQSASMKVFGINEFAARFPNAVCGIVTLLVVYSVGRRLFSRRFGRLWALAFLGSFLPSLFFRSGIIDPVFNLFIVLGIYFLSRATADAAARRPPVFALAGLFTGLAVLTKGPVALLVTLLSIAAYWAVRRSIRAIPIPLIILYCACVAGVSAAFYGLETLLHGPWFVTEFITYQVRLFSTGDAGHGRPFWFHFVILLFGCFPASFFAIRAFLAPRTGVEARDDFRRWMLILFWVVLILFSIVKTKTVLYSSLAYFPITFLAAWHMDGLLGRPPALTWQRGLTLSLAVFGALVGLAVTLFPVVMLNKHWVMPIIRDAFARACLAKPVVWTGWEALIGAAYVLVLAACVVLLARRRLLAGITGLLLSSALVLEGFMYVITPRIESYTQAGPIEFYKSLRGTDCYVKSIFKSYADLFYWEKKPGMRPESGDLQWLLTGPIDKPAYFVARANKAKRYIDQYGLSLVREDYGFVYLKREAVASGPGRSSDE